MRKVFILNIVFLYISLNAELVEVLDKRITENYFYNQIRQIHTLNFYINDYLLNKASIPSKINLTANYPGISANWPKTFSSVNEVSFSIDLANNIVRYTNITSVANVNIANIFRYNIAHTQSSIINTSDTIAASYYIDIPLNYETSEFLVEFNKLTNAAIVNVVIGSQTNNPCNFAMSIKTLYEPSGTGTFNLFQCAFPSGYKTIPTFDTNFYKTNIYDFSPANIGERVYTDFNTTHAIIKIYDNNISGDLTKYKTLKRD